MLDNKNLYNDKELLDDADLDWYDYGFRSYDAQIGRFTQLDPLTWDYPELTPYQYASNDPILNIDLDGLEGFNAAFTGVGTAANQLPDVVVKSAAKVAKTASPIVGAFKAASKAVPGALGALSDLIPNNSTGDKIVGGLLGAGEAGRDALVGAYNMVRHPINTIAGAAKLGTLDGQVEMGINIAGNYLQSKSDYGEDFTNSRFISYGITTVAIALAGTKGVGSFTETALSTNLVSKEGFLFGGINIKAPFDIPVQRFGTSMSLESTQAWGIRVGSNKIIARTFFAIKPEWNDLSMFTKGTIPRGTPIKFGIVGPQGLRPGGLLQFNLKSFHVVDQESKFSLKNFKR